MPQLLRILLTIALFGSISAAGFWTIEGHFFRSEPGANMLENSCPAYHIPDQYRYTHIPFPDQLICMLVEFFQVMFSPQHSSYTIHFLTGFSAQVTIFLIEGARSDKAWLSNPLVIGMVYQILGAGSIIPLALLIVIIASKGRARKPLTEAQAESVLIAVVFGYLLPSLWMFLTLEPKVMAIWQTFPIWQSLMQRLYLESRPKSTVSGFYATRLVLMATFIASAVVHISLLCSSPSTAHAPVSALVGWLPSWSLPDPKVATIESTAYHLIKWDSILSYSACILAGCAFAEGWLDVVLFLGMAPLGSALFSPGAYISLLWMYREWKLNQTSGLERGQERKVKEVKGGSGASLRNA